MTAEQRKEAMSEYRKISEDATSLGEPRRIALK
jgi:hypothetical protein